MKTSVVATILGILTVTSASLESCSAGDTPTGPRMARNDGGTVDTNGGIGHATGGQGGTNAGGTNVGGSTIGSPTNAGGGGASADGGGINGGGTSGGGGTTSTGGCPRLEPTWATPGVPSPAVCPGAAPPLFKKWLDDFDGDTIDATVTGWNIAADTTNGKCVVPQGGGGAGAIPLVPWGSHDASSRSGLRLQAYMGCLAPEGTNNWGAQWQFQTEPKKTARSFLDLSSYAGVVIWARLAGAPGKGNMTAAFMTPQTTPGDTGGDGTCGTAASPALCFGNYFAAAKVTQPCWAPITIEFSDLQPLGPAPVSGFDQAHVFGIQLAVSAWDTAEKTNFPVDIIIDDIYLY